MKKFKILVAEDEAPIRDGIVAAFTDSGYEVVAAGNGREAIDLLQDQNFDLVIEGMRKCGELGLLMIDAPEEYGGLELDKATSMLVGEKIVDIV